MAEVLGVAASAISVVGFASQLAQGATFLYHFFKDFKDAPEDIQTLSRELQIFTLILTNIHQSPSQPDVGLNQALKDCEEVIIKLSIAVNDIQPTRDIPQPKLWAKQLRATLKRPELRKHLRALERAKSTLLQCCMNAARVDQTREWNSIEAIETSLKDLTRDQASYSTATNDLTNLVRQVNSDNSALSATTTNIAVVTTETHALTERLVNETLRMQEVSARIEKATQDLVDSAFADQPALPRLLDQSIKQTVERSVRRHMNEALSSKTNQQTQDDTLGRKSPAYDENETISTYDTQHCCSRIDHSNIFKDGWVRTSTDSKMTTLTKNSLFGTITITTTAVSYRRRQRDQKPGEMDEKTSSYTMIKYLPGSWISPRGVIGTYITQIGPKTRTSNLSFGLRTVNIVPWNSDVISACRNLDLDAVCRLFDEGRASPYDVDPKGRNLVGWAVVGTRFESSLDSDDDYKDTADKLAQLIEMLTALGVDAGEWDKDERSPPMILCSSWLIKHPDFYNKYRNTLQYTMSMLLNRAKTDPFAVKEACLFIDDDGQYYGHLGSYPYSNVHSAGLEFLVKQEEWPLAWDPEQLRLLCDLSIPGYDMADHIRFWVTCSVTQVDAVLDAKFHLLQLFVKNNKAISAQLPYAVYAAIYHGGEVIRLLTEQKYSNGTTPWIRHRAKKLFAVRAWMLETLRSLLSVWLPILADKNSINEVSKYAYDHNLQAFRIWRMALIEACIPEEGRNGVTAESEQEEKGVHGNSDSEWKTENYSEQGCDWETEEEWEVNPILSSAIDTNPEDEENIQKKCPSTCRCQGYDEHYWSHVYNGISWYGYKNDDDTTPKVEEGMLKTFARAACSVAAYVV